MNDPLPSGGLDPVRTAVVVLAWPHGRVRPELVYWLADRGFPRHNVRFLSIEARDASQVANHAIHLALARNMPHTLFVDGDVRPDERTRLDLPFDLTCCGCDTGDPNSFAAPSGFHSAFWRCKTSSLARIPAPWFRYPEYVRGIAKVSQCYCQHFKDKARRAGLTIGWSGWVNHTPRSPAPTEDFICP